MVTPGFIAAAVMSRTSRASLHTFRIASWPVSSKRSHFDLLKRISRFGMPVSAQSGWGIDLGTGRRGESGYTGLTDPVNLYAGKGLKNPVAASRLEDKATTEVVRGGVHTILTSLYFVVHRLVCTLNLFNIRQEEPYRQIQRTQFLLKQS